MDTYDRKIILMLSKNSKCSYAQLADEVNLSQSACFRRVQHLQDTGVIVGFTIKLDPTALGNSVSAFAEVSVNRNKQTDVEEFKEVVRKSSHIISAHQLSGKTDFLLHIVASDIASYTTFLEQSILPLAAVRDMSSSIVLSEVKSHTIQIQ
jgi:DNA-binding Lrp family transcriptional regulator